MLTLQWTLESQSISTFAAVDMDFREAIVRLIMTSVPHSHVRTAPNAQMLQETTCALVNQVRLIRTARRFVCTSTIKVMRWALRNTSVVGYGGKDCDQSVDTYDSCLQDPLCRKELGWEEVLLLCCFVIVPAALLVLIVWLRRRAKKLVVPSFDTLSTQGSTKVALRKVEARIRRNRRSVEGPSSMHNTIGDTGEDPTVVGATVGEDSPETSNDDQQEKAPGSLVSGVAGMEGFVRGDERVDEKHPIQTAQVQSDTQNTLPPAGRETWLIVPEEMLRIAQHTNGGVTSRVQSAEKARYDSSERAPDWEGYEYTHGNGRLLRALMHPRGDGIEIDQHTGDRTELGRRTPFATRLAQRLAQRLAV